MSNLKVAPSFAASSNQHGWDLKYPMEEADFHENKLPEDIGEKWKDLARSLGFNHAFINSTEKEKNYCVKECCIEVLVRWREQNGKGATAEKLAEALVKTGLKNVAERVPFKSSDPSQVIRTDMDRYIYLYIHVLYHLFDTQGKTSSLAYSGHAHLRCRGLRLET